MHIRSRHLHLRALVRRGRGSKATLVRGYLCRQAILRQFRGVGTFGTEELVDVLREDFGIGQQGVVRGVVLSGGLDHRVGVLQLPPDGLELLQRLSSLLRLVQQGVFDDAGIAV